MKVLNVKNLAMLLISFLIIGCAKELPEELPDAVQPNVFELSQIKKGKVQIVTKRATTSKAIQVNDKSISGFFALNEKSLYPIDVVSD